MTPGMKFVQSWKSLVHGFVLTLLLVHVADASDSVVAFGDSITRGYPYFTNNGSGEANGSYTPGLQSRINGASWDAVVQNYGYPGEYVSFDVGQFGSGEIRLKGLLGSGRYFLIMEGTNDLHWTGPTAITNALYRMVVDVKNSGGIPVLGTLIPRYDGEGGNIPTINATVKQIAAEQEIEVADLYNAPSGANWLPYLVSDLLHPNLAGYSLMVDVWFNALLAARGSQASSSQGFPLPAIYLLLGD